MSTAKITRRLAIQDGPRSEIIWVAAQHAHSPEIIAVITFTLRTGGLPQSNGEVVWPIISPKITGVSHEDNSGQSLNIEGYLDRKHFTGYYDARRREGVLNVEL